MSWVRSDASMTGSKVKAIFRRLTAHPQIPSSLWKLSPLPRLVPAPHPQALHSPPSPSALPGEALFTAPSTARDGAGCCFSGVVGGPAPMATLDGWAAGHSPTEARGKRSAVAPGPHTRAGHRQLASRRFLSAGWHGTQSNMYPRGRVWK